VTFTKVKRLPQSCSTLDSFWAFLAGRLPVNSYQYHALAVGVFLLAAITSARAESPLTVVAGEGSDGEIMVGMDVVIYTDGIDDVRHFMGNRFFAGGHDGALGPVTVIGVGPPECGNTTLSFAPKLPDGFFAAYSDDTRFAALSAAPELHDAVVRGVDGPIRSAGGIGEVVPYAIWRFKLPGSSDPLVFATIRTPNYRDNSWGDPGGFDAIALMRQDGESLSVLDVKVTLAHVTSLSNDVDLMAVAINPSTGGTDLFVRYQSHEYREFIAYDIGQGTFTPRLHSECSM
jgi:hypothetical protein